MRSQFAFHTEGMPTTGRGLGYCEATELQPGDFVTVGAGARRIRAIQASGKNAPLYHLEAYEPKLPSFVDAEGRAWISWQHCGSAIM